MSDFQGASTEFFRREHAHLWFRGVMEYACELCCDGFVERAWMTCGDSLIEAFAALCIVFGVGKEGGIRTGFVCKDGSFNPVGFEIGMNGDELPSEGGWVVREFAEGGADRSVSS